MVGVLHTPCNFSGIDGKGQCIGKHVQCNSSSGICECISDVMNYYNYECFYPHQEGIVIPHKLGIRGHTIFRLAMFPSFCPSIFLHSVSILIFLLKSLPRFCLFMFKIASPLNQ